MVPHVAQLGGVAGVAAPPAKQLHAAAGALGGALRGQEQLVSKVGGAVPRSVKSVPCMGRGSWCPCAEINHHAGVGLGTHLMQCHDAAQLFRCAQPVPRTAATFAHLAEQHISGVAVQRGHHEDSAAAVGDAKACRAAQVGDQRAGRSVLEAGLTRISGKGGAGSSNRTNGEQASTPWL